MDNTDYRVIGPIGEVKIRGQEERKIIDLVEV